MNRGLFIAGTSTGVGKTHVAALLARRLTVEGLRVGVYKPVASGCRRQEDQLIADDAVALWEAANRPRTLAEVCPQLFSAPLAPPLAAFADGREVNELQLLEGLDCWRKESDVLLVEGAGGLMSPLSAKLYNIDLARQLGLPLLIVADNALGAINATLQTLITARSLAPELPIAGVVLNQAQSRPDDVSLATNAFEIAARGEVPLWGPIAWRAAEWPDEDFVRWVQRFRHA